MRTEIEIREELSRLKKMRKLKTGPGFPDMKENLIIVNEAINSLEWVLGIR